MDLSLTEYKSIVESSPNMIWRAGTDTKCNYFNDTWLKFTGKKMEDEIGNGWVDGVHPDDRDLCIRIYLEAFEQRNSFEMEYRLVRHDGEWRWINDRGVPLFDESGTFLGYIGSCIDVTERVEGVNLIEMAHKDKLTGPNNRNYFDHLIKHEFKKTPQELQELTLMMMDVDRFKSFNDQYGHAMGDKVLNQVAHKLSVSLRKSDIAGRYGGDEFVVILHGLSEADTQKMARRILKAICGIHIEDNPMKISISMGIVRYQNEKNEEELIERADQAMYMAKKQGGNQYYFESSKKINE